jgi:MFS family permease
MKETSTETTGSPLSGIVLDNCEVALASGDAAHNLDFGGQEVMDKATMEHLGRQRPDIIPNLVSEVIFVFTVVMSTTIAEYFIGGFNIVLPPIATALDMPESARTWPAGATTLTMASLLQPSARACDMYGGRIVFLSGHMWLLVWSLVCGFSQNTNMLIVCRAMQGMGSAAFLPAGLAILSQTYRPGPRKNIIFAIFGAFSCVGFYFGIFIGAVSAEYLDWRWYFWIGSIVSLIICVCGLVSMPSNATMVDPALKMDWLGVLTIVPGLILVLFAFLDGGQASHGWKTPYIYITLIIGVILLATAVYVQGWVSAQPLLPLDMFRAKYMKRLTVGLFCTYGVFGLFLFYASF